MSVWGVRLFCLLFTQEEWWLNFRDSISMQHSLPHFYWRFGGKKVCALFVPHKLTDEEEYDCTASCADFLHTCAMIQLCEKNHNRWWIMVLRLWFWNEVSKHHSTGHSEFSAIPKTVFPEVKSEDEVHCFLQAQRVHTRESNIKQNLLQRGHGLVIEVNYSCLPQFAHVDRLVFAPW